MAWAVRAKVGSAETLEKLLMLQFGSNGLAPMCETAFDEAKVFNSSVDDG